MGKKKGKGKESGAQGTSQGDQRQRRTPQQVYQVPQRRDGQPASGQEEQASRPQQQPSRQQQEPRREHPVQHAEERRREQPVERVCERRGQTQSSEFEAGAEKSQISQKPFSEETASRPKGRGRGRGKTSPDLPEVGAQPSFFFEKETPKAGKEDFPKTSPAAEKGESSKDASVRKKVLKTSEEKELISKFTGISFEEKTPIRFKMATRPDYGRLGVRIGLYVNYFRLQYKNASVYHYDIDILEATKDKKMGESLMSKGRTAQEDIKKKVKHVERQKRRNIGKAKCRQIISEMVKTKQFQKFYPVYDSQKNLFTSKPLPIKEKVSYPVQIVIDGSPKDYFVSIQPVEKAGNPKGETNRIDMQPLINLYTKRSSEIPLEVLLVYETIMNHRDPPFNDVQFRNSFFSLKRESVHSLGAGLEVWFGYNQSVHLTELGPVVIINMAAKAFHKAGNVLDYASDVLNCDIKRLPKLENWHIKELDKALKGLQVKVTYQRQPRKYKIRGVQNKTAKDITLEDKKTNLMQYYRQKYNTTLSYPHLPCLFMNSSNNNTFIPMELCMIVEGQPKIGKLSGELTSKMIRSTAIPPDQRFRTIDHDAKKVQSKSKQYLDAYGLIMSIDLLKVDGRLIPAPQLQYDSKDAVAKPDKRGVWRIEDGRKFYKVVQVKSWALISFANERYFGKEVLSKYCHFLVQSANKCGIQMGRPDSINIFGRNVSTDKAISDAKRSGIDFAIVVLNRNDNNHTYDEVKFLADFKYRLVTQCMEDKTLGRINDQITTNVCLKLNVKMGGINHILKHGLTVFAKPVMVIGADAIHWPRGYGYPSIVSVVGSYNPTASRYALICSTQRNERKGKISQEIIRNMKEISSELLEAFKMNANIYPQKIIVFRDGVSEGQFQHAIDYEVSGIQEACQETMKVVVPITYIVVQKRHQTRFMPQNPAQSAGKCKNVPPGTVVDKDISHPVFFDYFVCAHEGIQGTSKPAHYTVLHDDNKFKSDELQQLSYFLCHTYVRCTRSVSLPAPVLYADLAAFRAKKYADRFVDPDDASISSGEDIEREYPPTVIEAIKSMKSFQHNMFYV